MPVKQPTDHLPKTNGQAAPEPDEYFSFDHDGETYTMPNKTLDVITTGFIRKNRRLDDMDYVLTAVETLIGARDADGKEIDPGKEGKIILDAFDSLDRHKLVEVMKGFQAHIGASLGE